jgi:hypothetical protein
LKSFLRSPIGQLIIVCAVSIGIFVAFAIGGRPGPGAAAAAGGFVLSLLIVFGRRFSDTLAIMSGTGDERGRVHYESAIAFAGMITVIVLFVWFLVTTAHGDPNKPLAICTAIFGVLFIGRVIVLARRS